LVKLFLTNHSISDKEMSLIIAALAGFSGADIEEICIKTIIDSLLQNDPISLPLIFNNIFEFLNIGRNINGDSVLPKTAHRMRVKYLRGLNEKVFSYAQIALVLGISKSYVSNLIKTKEDDENE